MFHTPSQATPGLLFNPFKSCCVPRPIGWLSTVSATGIHNLAPYSQFQNLTWDPPTVMVAANARPDGSVKDSTCLPWKTRMCETDLQPWVTASMAAHPRLWPIRSSKMPIVGRVIANLGDLSLDP